MKKLIIVTAIFISGMYFLYIQAKHFWRGELMSVKKVCNRWGEAPLDVAKFKAVKGEKEEEPTRAKMACSLLRHQKQYIGKDTLEIRELFGGYSGYYFSDMYPVYMIERAKTGEQDSWQIVFFIDRHTKVSSIAVHKNCCDR